MRNLLEGVKVLAVEQYAAGPYGTMLLADLGAEIVKIENRETGGDFSRGLGPHRLGEHDSEFFQTFNPGKKSVCLDLKSPADRRRFERLVRDADAVANNLRGDKPEKLGLTFAQLKTVNPAIVCAHLSAYGRDNSRAAWPGYDYLMQAEAGFLSMTGEPGGPPARFGLSIIDFMTGLMMAFGLVSAVLSARRTGEGCDVDTSLYDVALHQLSYPATWYLNEGERTERLPRSAHPSITPSQLVTTRNGWLFLMCQTQGFWEEFCRLAEREEWTARPEFATMDARRENRARLQEELDALFATQDTEHWIGLLAGRVPVAPVHDIAGALDNPFVREAEMLRILPHPMKPGGVSIPGAPFRVNGERPPGRPAPALGQHTEEFLKPARRGPGAPEGGHET
ncbi:MAG: CaiB/BaiF CoA transferase family protein [Alphaproteobacteria bacterium]